MPTRGLYSVVQYLPDDGRREAANVGVVLFVPSRRILDIRVSPTLERVRRFFHPGKQELSRIEMGLEALKHRLGIASGEFTSEDQFLQFVASRADAIRLSSPRVVMVEEPYADLTMLYDELVGDRERVAQRALTGISMPAILADVFGRLEAQGKIRRPGNITLPTTSTRFEVPIAYQNGRVNYVKPQSLATRKIDHVMADLGFNGRLIYRHPIEERESKLVVISSDPGADPQVENRFSRVLPEFDVKFVPHTELEEFAEEVESSAHDFV